MQWTNITILTAVIYTEVMAYRVIYRITWDNYVTITKIFNPRCEICMKSNIESLQEYRPYVDLLIIVFEIASTW